MTQSPDSLGAGMGWEVGERLRRRGHVYYLWLIHVDAAETNPKLVTILQ